MSSLFPGFRLFTRTPVVMHYRDGVLEFLGEGCDAILWLLRELSRMNITSASLFPGMDGYARSIRETYESLDDEAPAYRQIALETMEDLGWTG